MKIIRFLGGLGNQMFQYALYKALQKRFPNVKADLQGYKDYPLHNGFELEHIFNIKTDKVSPFISNIYYVHNRKWIYRKFRRLLNLKNAYQEERGFFTFDPSILTNPEQKYYWGYWQNYQYFKDIEEEIRTDFSFKTPLSERNQEVLNRISDTNSVSIHIRRGDYLKDPFLGGLCGPEYYQAAINYIQSHVPSSKFFVFSDDIPWCAENLKHIDCEFISWNKGPSSYIDMQLMTACKHNIIANSSFSWWAAWLNPYQDKIVISPKKWANDSHTDVTTFTPDSWIKL